MDWRGFSTHFNKTNIIYLTTKCKWSETSQGNGGPNDKTTDSTDGAPGLGTKDSTEAVATEGSEMVFKDDTAELWR